MAVASMGLGRKDPVLGKTHQPSTVEIELNDQPRSPTSRPLSKAPPHVQNTPLLQLPPEIIHSILSNLSAPDLARVSATCRFLAEHATYDFLWADVINSYLPTKIQDPGVFDSFRSLYIAHHPCWFIPQKRVWFSDTEHTGNLILARYDHRRGVIEAYRVIAERRNHQFQTWDWNPDVIVQTFHPKTSLWLDDPVLFLKNPGGERCYLNGETRMPMALETQNVFNAFSLCPRKCPSDPDPNKLWPPPTIPSDHHVYRNAELHVTNGVCRPPNPETMSEHAFRIRRWAHFRLGMPIFTAGRSEALATYSTLDPHLYTPTEEKPYQGIWVGDYSAHGCEFLLFMQRDLDGGDHDTSPSDGDEIIHRGSFEAVKLTGDPNVPRGEISFASNDIGPGGFIRIADDALFKGARVVRSRGHVAGLGFRDGRSSFIILALSMVGF